MEDNKCENKEQIPLRILHVLVLNVNSGVASMVMNLYRNIDRSRIQFDFITWNIDKNSNYIAETQKMGARVYEISSYKKDLFAFKKEAKTVLAENHFDGIHCHEYLVNIPFLYWAMKRKIPLRITHSHNPTINSFIKRDLTVLCRGLFARYATNFFACSKESGEFLFGKNAKVSIIPNGIEVSRFSYSPKIRSELRKSMGIQNNFVIGSIGRLEAQKNFSFLLNVFYELCKEEKNVKLIIAGDGTQRDSLKLQAETMGISEKVSFLGVCANVPDLLQVMDLFILPSLFEGLGIVLVEAQANGVSCIASDTIPREVKVNNNLKFLSLKAGKEIWAKVIEQEIQKNGEREAEKVSCSPFNIKYSVDILEREYLEQLKRRR